jgi:hypothetical protein
MPKTKRDPLPLLKESDRYERRRQVATSVDITVLATKALKGDGFGAKMYRKRIEMHDR